MYEDHARNNLPRLKRAYFARCQALEDHKRQERAIVMQAKLLADSPTSPSSSLKEHPYGRPMSPPTATGAQPPASNPAMLSPDPYSQPEKKGNRLRAGSASGAGDVKEVFTDLAAQSKKGFSAIMQKLGGDKGDKEESGGYFASSHGLGHGGGGGSLGGVTAGGGVADELQRRHTVSRGDPARGMGTMKGVRVKREAEEADKAYRLGVFHLESLRLRCEKLQSSAVKVSRSTESSDLVFEFA